MNRMLLLRRSMVQVRTNPLRTMLTLLGIVFGVGAVVAMMSIGEGAQREILTRIEAMGATSVHVNKKSVPSTELSSLINDSLGLSREDVAAIEAVLPQAQGVAYRARHDLGVTDLSLPVHELEVMGVNPEIFRVHNLELLEGRALHTMDHEYSSRVAVLAQDVARRAFPDGALGRMIRLDYTYFEVVGVLKSPGASAGGEASTSWARGHGEGEEDTEDEGARGLLGMGGGGEPVQGIDAEAYERAVLVPFTTMVAELAPAREYNELDMISVKVETTAQTLPTKSALERLLTELHGRQKDFEIVAPEEILRQRQSAQAIFNAVLISIAAISLLVGGIGVMNIMLANIMERIAEIGLRRAIGAKRRDIRDQFLLESVLLCCVGGVLGILLGLGLSWAVGQVVGLPVAVSWVSMVLSFGISLFVGVTFGLVPAIRAANVDPIDALRGK
ncbi:MAG: ABC transporter permease [Myxococcota bacterium]